MKRNLFLSAILPFSLAVALCACGSTPGESTPSEKTQSSVSQAQTDSAATGNEISIGNNFSIEAGTVLSDGSIYFVGREGADGFCAYVSTDDGDSWTKEELPWADQTVVGIKLRPDGFMLGMQGQQVVYAARGEDLKTADISALGAIDGISAVYPIDGDTFTVTGGRTETFVNEDYPIYSEGKLSKRKQLFHLSLRNRLPALRQTPISESDTDSQNDERQALKRIVVFFAVMLILTLVARGTSSAIRPVVTTQQAKAGTISQSVQSSGSITASSVLSVSLPEGVVLDNILVKEGQSVVEGQTLATCDVDELSTKLDRAKASLQKSKAEYNQLLSNAVLDDTSVARTQQALLRAYEADQKAYEELEKLRASENPDPEAISTAEQAADDAHWAAQQAEYDRNSALASYQEMQRQNNLSAQVNQASAEDVALDIKDTQAEIEQLEQLVNQQGVISSPFSGVISNVEAEVGTESTQTFCTIYDTSKGYLFACELPAAQASDCQTGLSAVIKQGDQTETAAITAISENAENDTVDITIQLTATDWKVGPADAEIVLSEQDYDLCLPNTAIHQDNQGDFVFAVEEKNTVLGTQNVLVRIPVTVLEVGQSQTSIEGAISPEDSIVVQSTRSLEAGSKVRVKNENA